MTGPASADARTPAPADAPARGGLRGWCERTLTGGSGAEVAGAFHRALAGVFLIAWISLAVQVRLLIGHAGLMPLADFVEAARGEGALSISTFPSWLALAPHDGVLVAGTSVGIALACLGLLGVRPRVIAGVQTVLYLGYVCASRVFLGFQWDNLLLECGALAALLPVDPGRRAPIAHLAFRLLLFKLYFESGLAKWQSPIGDWQDGSAMTYYYETAPLPTALAWYAHHLPRGWHLFESRATLAIELILPFAVFGPRRARLVAAALFTGFQAINAATANYGFFCYLSFTLHLFLLDDADLRRCREAIARRLAPIFQLIRARLSRSFVAAILRLRPRLRLRLRLRLRVPRDLRPGVKSRRRLHGAAAILGLTVWLFISATEALFLFGDPGRASRVLIPILELSQTFRLVNSYHLFAAVTRRRIEPEFQIRVGERWTAAHLRYKPGDPDRAPPFVAPHQPRVDFLLWFYGLSYERRNPIYVSELLAKLCEEPAAVAPLFAMPLPAAPAAVRIVFWDYAFTSGTERHSTGAWWSRKQVAATREMSCGRAP